MNLTINLDTLEVTSTERATKVSQLTFKRRDDAELRVLFVRNGTPELLPEGHELIFGIKPAFGSPAVVFTDVWEEPEGGTEDPNDFVYVATPSFNTVELNALFTPATKASVSLLAEFSWKMPGVRSTPTLKALVSNDLLQNGEGPPTEAAPPYPILPTADTVLAGANDGLSWIKLTFANLWAKFIANDALWFPAARISRETYWLNSLGEDVGLDYANGPYQYGYINGDWTPSGIVGGEKGDILELEINWSSGAHLMDLSNIRLTDAQAATMPVTVEPYRCFLLTFRHMGGGWCLTGVTGSYTESED
jgi:hypothetical protein